jgi:hypothetical protein
MGGAVSVRKQPEHIRFVEHRRFRARLTKSWDVVNWDSQHDLGEVKWYAQWRRYCFFPDQGTIYDGSCLLAISEFCHNQTLARKLERAAMMTDHGVRGKPYGA